MTNPVAVAASASGNFDFTQQFLGDGIGPEQIAKYNFVAQPLLSGGASGVPTGVAPAPVATTGAVPGLNEVTGEFDLSAYYAASGITPEILAKYEATAADPQAAIDVAASGIFQWFHGATFKLNAWEAFEEPGSPGIFTNKWGNAGVAEDKGVVAYSEPSAILESGIMVPAAGAHAGYGEGLWVWAAKFDHNNSHSVYGLGWPADDKWPGQEIDFLEIMPGGPDGGREYGTVHWAVNGQPGTGGAENNGYKSFFYPNLDAETEHWYWMDWRADRLVFGVDNQIVHIETEHVPRDAAHGGVNLVPGVGISDDAGHGGVGEKVSSTLLGFIHATPVSDAPLV